MTNYLADIVSSYYHHSINYKLSENSDSVLLIFEEGLH